MKSSRSSASAGVARRNSGWILIMSGGIFDGKCHAHATAYAKGRESAPRIALQHFVEQRDSDARAGAADGMAERERASVDIEFRAIEMQFAVAGQHLRGKSFVEFDEIEVGEFQAVLRFHLSDGRDRPDSHDARIHTGGGYGHNPRQWFEIVLLDKAFTGEDDCRSAVRDA